MNTKPIKESICSYEQCKRLKRLGFDWNCFCRYENNIEGIPWLRIGGYPVNYNSGETCLSAPTVEYAHRWLQKRYEMIVVIYPRQSQKATPFGYSIFIRITMDIIMVNKEWYASYDEAMKNGIDDLLRFIEKNFIEN